MLYSCILIKEIVDKRTIAIGNVTFKFDLPAMLDAKLLRLMFLNIPVYITDVVRGDLGSQKLALQLKNDKIPQTLSDAFLQTSLYADLKLDEYLGGLRALRDKARAINSTMFLEFILMKMRNIFLRLGLQPDEQEPFLRMAAELAADLKGSKGDDRVREIDRYIEELRKRDRVIRLRGPAIIRPSDCIVSRRRGLLALI